MSGYNTEDLDRIWDEAAAFTSRGTDAADAGLQDWLARSPQHAAAYKAICSVAEDPALSAALARCETGWQKRPVPQRRIVIGWAMAAAFVGFALFNAAQFGPDFFAKSQIYETAYGEQRTVALADGSQVVLNGGTRLAVKPGGRAVALEQGEAYFSVAHDPAHPFIVSLRAGSVTVLGTEFDLSYDPKGVALQVYQGRVRLTGEHASAVFGRGQHGRLSGHAVQFLGGFDPAAGDWRSGWIEPANWTLERVAQALSRHSGTPIRFAGNGLKDKRVTGRLRLDDAQIQLSNLAEVYGFSVVREGEALVLK